MNHSIQKKRETFAKQIRSQQKQAYFERERKKLFEAQLDGDVDLEHLIIAELIDQFGSEDKVLRMLAEYEAYEKSVQQWEKMCEEEEEASMNFQKLQEQKKISQERQAIMRLFEEMEKQQNEPHPNGQKDVEI